MELEFDDRPCATQRACAGLGAWHVLVGCLLLNKTGRKQARAALRLLFELVPDPGDLDGVADAELVPILRSCGLVNRRIVALRNLTADWLEGKPVHSIRHCGQYAWDSFDIFVDGLRIERRPDMDAEIGRYLSEMEQSHS